MDSIRPRPILALMLATAALMLLGAHSARASDAALDDPHVRPLTSGMSQFFAEGMVRSETIRSLVHRLEESDVIVYLRARPFTSTLTTGHLLFVSATPGRRYVMIEIACERSWATQLATLGHELRHAVEVAEAPSVRSDRGLAAYYSTIGIKTNIGWTHEEYETQAAHDAGIRVARELAVTPIGNGQRAIARR
jgi:hypothetical protein